MNNFPQNKKQNNDQGSEKIINIYKSQEPSKPAIQRFYTRPKS